MKEYENTIEKIDDKVTEAPHYKVEDVFGFFEIVSVAPTAVPIKFKDQIKFYVNGGTFRLYFYDTNAQTWRYMYNYVHP